MASDGRWVGMGTPCRTTAADLALLRERLDDLDRRRIEALMRPAITSCAVRQRLLETMRLELAEVEWHLAQLEVAR